MSGKIRIDQLMVERGLAESRERAQRLIRAGLVVAGDHRVDKPGAKVDPQVELRLKGEQCPYVSRGGLKLAGALKAFGRTAQQGRLGLDVGASTGGFTDCMLQHGVEQVWAVDTGRGQLHSSLVADQRVHFREAANARFMEPAWLDGYQPQIVAIDVSFISLRLVLPAVKGVMAADGEVFALVKPQFEAGPTDVGRGGVVKDPSVHARVLNEIIVWCEENGWTVQGACPSDLLGPAGNREFFLWLSPKIGQGGETVDGQWDEVVAAVIEQGEVWTAPSTGEK